MIVAAGIRTRYDWQPDLRFMVRLDIYSYSTENYSPDILTSQSFSVDDPEALVNEAIHAFVLDYVTTEWGMVIDPAVDTIVIINPYEKAPPPLALNTDKLLAYWKLDEDTSGVSGLVDSHASFDLTNNGGVTFEAGQVGDAARFASLQSLSRAYDVALNPTDALTFSCWVKVPYTGIMGIAGTWTHNTNQGWALVVDTGGGFTVYVASDALDTGNNFGSTPSAWNDDLWHHVVVSIDTAGATDADRLTITVDDAPQTLTFTGSIPAAIIDGGGPFTIGDWPGMGYMEGAIDECELRDGGGAIIASWTFDGILRADSVGENHLREVGSVMREATPDGSYAAVFDTAVPGYLTIDNSADLMSGDFDWTVSFMAKHDPIDGSTAPLFSFLDTVTPRTVISLVRLSGGQIQLTIHDGAVEQGMPSDFYLDPNGYGGIWAHFRVWYDSVGEIYYVQMNAQPAQAVGNAIVPVAGSTRFSIGGDGQDIGVPPVVFSGATRRVAYYKRVLTDEEWAIIYNDGIGQDYPFETNNLPLLRARNASYCRLAADHAISDTGKTSLPDMSFTLEPYTNYSVELTLFTTSNDAAVGVQCELSFDGDILHGGFNFQGPASDSTLLWLTAPPGGPFAFDPVVSQGNVPGTVKISGTIEVGATGGLLELSHGSSDASLTTVLRGSWGMLARH